MFVFPNRVIRFALSSYFARGRYTENFWQEFFRRYLELLPIKSYLFLLFSYFLWSKEPARTVSLRVTNKEMKKLKRIDPWLHNLILCDREMLGGSVILQSKPWNLALPIADLCNARCTFCVSWLRGGKTLELEELKNYEGLLPYAKEIGLQGLGEPLANPKFGELVEHLVLKTDKRATFYLITNGIFVSRHSAILAKAPITRFNISLNAATKETHNKVMGLGEDGFNKVLDGINKLIEIRNSTKGTLVILSMVLTADNFHEVEDFIKLAENLKVNQVILRSLMPINEYHPGLNYHLLPPILLPNFRELSDRAKLAIANANVSIIANVESWNIDPRPNNIKTELLPIISRESALKNKMRTDESNLVNRKFFGRKLSDSIHNDQINPYGRKPPLLCDFPYQQYVSTQLNGRLVPCCYMTDVPDHEPIQITEKLEDSWNSQALQNLRISLKSGPLLIECQKCPLARNAIN